MSVPQPLPSRRLAFGERAFRRVRAGLQDRRGATAVEFAIIAAPFIFMIFCIIEVAIFFMVQVTLDNATSLAARQLRTGQVVADGNTDTSGKQAFMTAVCANMSWLQNQCQSGVTNGTGLQYLVVDVRPLGTYSTGSSAPAMTSNGAMNTSNFCFYSGSAGSAVEMRTFYRWQLLTPYLMQAMQTFAGGVAELTSTEVFQVEPNGQTNPGATPC